MLNLQKLVAGYHDGTRSMGELLPWSCLYDESTVLTSDSGLLACFTYDGLDAEGRSEVEIDSAVSAFERSFSSFGSGTAIWSIIDRRRSTRYPVGSMRTPIGSYLQDAWVNQVTAEQYENSYSLAVFQRSSVGAMALFDAMDRIVKEEDIGLGGAFVKALKTKLSTKAKIRFDRRQVQAAEAALEARVTDLQANLASLGLRRLSGEQLLAYLHTRANPVSGGRAAIPIARVPAFLNHYLASDEVYRYPRALKFTDGVTTKWVGVVSLKGWPNGDSAPGMLDYLTAIDGEITIAHCFRPLDRDVASAAISKMEKYHMTAAVPFMRRLFKGLSNGGDELPQDEGRLALAQDARNAQAEITALNRVFGYHNLTALVFADSQEELADLQLQLMRRMSLSEFTGMAEGMHALSAWTQTLPGQWRAGVRWTNVSMGNAADIAPIRTLWAGPATCDYMSGELQSEQPALIAMPTDSAVPVNFDAFESGAGHTAIVGPTRAGKSVFVNLLLSQFEKYPDARVIHFDKDYSAMIMTLLHDGTHVDLTNDRASGGARLAPIALVSDPKHHPWIVNWVTRLIEQSLQRVLDPKEKDTITQGVAGLAELPPDRHRLSYLATSLGNLRGALDEWIGDGANAGWFDNEPVVVEIGDRITFEMRELFKDRRVALFAMDYLFYLVGLAVSDKRPTIINVEETWFFLSDPVFVDKMDDIVRTGGKNRAALWITSQGAYELTNNEKLAVVMEQFKNYVFLPNDKIFTNPKGYNLLGLTEEQMHRIQSATPKRNYYLKTPGMSRMCDVQLPREMLVCLEAGARATQTFRRHYETRDVNPNWKADYFDEMMN